MEIYRTKFNNWTLLKTLMVLLVTNYMIVTIIFKDNFVLKYLRDILLIWLIIDVIKKRGFSRRKYFFWFVFILLLLIAFINTDNIATGVVSIRKYLFPIALLIVCENMRNINNNFQSFSIFCIIFFTIVSIWGVFQVYVLGSGFLEKLGYPTYYSYAYGRYFLGYSYYFGNLGLQRVVSTLSNSNVCGLILGNTLLFAISLYPYIKYKYKNYCLIIIAIGYLLTFSRSNFLALFIIGIIILYPYIPYKKTIFMALIVTLIVAIGVGIFQGNSGYVYKIANWVMSSISLTDSSVAGRSVRWKAALEAILRSPFGIGFGHVGSLAINAGSSYVLDCENSYLAVALDCGIIGAVAYYGIVIGNIKYLNKKMKYKSLNNRIKRLCICGESILIYTLIVCFFSNHIYDMEAMSISYIYVGFALCNIRNETSQRRITI